MWMVHDTPFSIRRLTWCIRDSSQRRRKIASGWRKRRWESRASARPLPALGFISTNVCCTTSWEWWGKSSCCSELRLNDEEELHCSSRFSLGQGEGDQRVAELFFGDFRVAAGGDDEVLLAGGAQAISHRRSVTAGGQLCLPQFLARFDVEAAKETVRGTGDEDEAARGHDGSAEADR